MLTLSFKNLAIAEDIHSGMDFQDIAAKHGVPLDQVEFVADQLEQE